LIYGATEDLFSSNAFLETFPMLNDISLAAGKIEQKFIWWGKDFG